MSVVVHSNGGDRALPRTVSAHWSIGLGRTRGIDRHPCGGANAAGFRPPMRARRLAL